MISLSIFIAMNALLLLLTAWAVSRSARIVGSQRGQFRYGLIVVFIILILNVGITLIGSTFSPVSNLLALVMGTALLIIQLAVYFFLLRYTFKLSGKRTLVPFGGFVVLILAYLGFTWFVIKPYLIEAFVVPTVSMSPTIERGDRFIVNKVIAPRRFDLVAYWSQEAHPVIYCKRLIGLPGERLRFEQGGLYVNDCLITLPPVLAGRCHASPSRMPLNQALYRDGQSIVLGHDEYFFIGDNVEASLDSRVTGPSRTSSLVGVIDLMYWPLSKAQIVR